MRKQHTAEDRERLIAEVRATGETARVVAERLGICASSAYRWMKEAAVPGAPVFARAVRARVSRPGLVVQLGRATILVEAGFDAELLRNVAAALGGST
jgi:transposase-like protein